MRGPHQIFEYSRTNTELIFFIIIVVDSPGVPASANAHELFRGFSFIAPCLLEEMPVPLDRAGDHLTKVRTNIKDISILTLSTHLTS